MLIPLIVLGTGILMLAVERLKPGRDWPKVRGWWTRALLLNVCQAGAVYLAGVAWDGWMLSRRPWEATALGPTSGAIAGYLAITFVFYWWHRWRHEFTFLWRWFHQVHHSPQRIEVITSFYKHPFEVVMNSFISSAVVYLGVGLDPRAAVNAVLLSGLAELFYHWNVATPHWVGYIFQRPESHCVHHEEGLHSFNYSDLPLWDMMFGTFRNPREWKKSCGFGPDGERRLAEMLAGVDLTPTQAPRAN